MSIIKIPNEIWCAQRPINNNQNADDTLAYMTYSDATKASEKKRSTGRSWAGSNCRETTLSNVEPIEGFILGDAVSRYSTSNKLVRVKDPRGFTVEMFIHDLVYLLENCTVVNGVIQEACRWGQNGKGHILIPEGSDMEKTVEYILAMKKTPNLDPNDLRIGDKYVTTTGAMIVYGGKWHFTGEVEHTFRVYRGGAISTTICQKFEFEQHTNNFYSSFNPQDIGGFNQSKVIGIYETTPLTPQEVEANLSDPYYFRIPADASTQAAHKSFKTKHSGKHISWDKKVINCTKTFIH